MSTSAPVLDRFTHHPLKVITSCIEHFSRIPTHTSTYARVPYIYEIAQQDFLNIHNASKKGHVTECKIIFCWLFKTKIYVSNRITTEITDIFPHYNLYTENQF